MAPIESFAPVHADVDSRIRDTFDHQPLMRHLGARLGTVAEGRVHILLPRGPHLSGHHGHIHPGATSAIGDTAGEFAALTCVDLAEDIVAFEYKINFLAPAEGDQLEAIGTVMKTGRSLTVCRIEVFANGTEPRLVATGQQTLLRVGDR